MEGKQPEQAWWLNLTITPNQSILDGIDITKFNKSWTRAVYLDNSLIKKQVSTQDYIKLINSKFSLLLSKDINNNKINEIIKVGVFQNSKNKKGIFLAIFENSKLSKVFTDSSNKGFSALIDNSNSIRWYKCMNCGEYETIRCNGKAYVLE